jgi:hypothetical protein
VVGVTKCCRKQAPVPHGHPPMMLGADESRTPSITPSFWGMMTTSPQSLSPAAARTPSRRASRPSSEDRKVARSTNSVGT